MNQPRKPAIFRIPAEPGDTPKTTSTKRQPAGAVVLADTPDAFAAEAARETAEIPLRPKDSSFSVWTKLFWSALTGLLSLALGLWFWRLVEDLFKTSPVAGWVGIVLLGLAALALVILVVREWRGLSRLKAVTAIRTLSETAFAEDNSDKAKSVIRQLMQFQSSDPSTASQRTAMDQYMGEIIDGRGLLTLADRTLLQSRDERAKAVIASAAKRVSVVTALSPRAIVDVLFVAAQSVMLTRRVAEIYGTRPGNLGFLRLARKILGHLAITGGVAISDSVLSQLVGHGLAARLSAKLGEGVLNGLLTARVGLACIAACRPLPFLASEEPKLQDVAGEILSNPFGKNS